MSDVVTVASSKGTKNKRKRSETIDVGTESSTRALKARKKAEINAKNKRGENPLSLALKGRHYTSALMLLESGADPAVKIDGAPGLGWVVTRILASLSPDKVPRELRTIIEILLRSKRAIELKCSCKGIHQNSRCAGKTLLITFSQRGIGSMVQKLLDVGADVNARSNDGDTALMGASLAGKLPIVEDLLNAGAEVNAKNRFGSTALMWASSQGHYEIVRKLLSVGADRSIKTSTGNTALMFASKHGHPETIKVLLEFGVGAEPEESVVVVVTEDSEATEDEN